MYCDECTVSLAVFSFFVSVFDLYSDSTLHICKFAAGNVQFTRDRLASWLCMRCILIPVRKVQGRFCFLIVLGLSQAVTTQTVEMDVAPSSRK